MELLILWASMAGLTAWLAKKKGRNPFGWLLFSLFLWPVALLIVLAAPERTENLRHPCPHCAEMILPAAKVCPFCKRDVEPVSTPEPKRDWVADDSGAGSH